MDIDLKINVADKDLWTAALDGGEYQQARQSLFDGKGYCCLGVLAKVKGCNFFKGTHSEYHDGNEIEVEDTDYTVEALDYGDVNDSGLLDPGFASRANLTNDHQQLLSKLNDGTCVAFAPSNPMHAVCEKLGLRSTPSIDLTGFTEFRVERPYTFAEISQIIKDHF